MSHNTYNLFSHIHKTHCHNRVLLFCWIWQKKMLTIPYFSTSFIHPFLDCMLNLKAQLLLLFICFVNSFLFFSIPLVLFDYSTCMTDWQKIENVFYRNRMNWNILKYHERRKHKQIKEDEKKTKLWMKGEK